MKDPSKTDQELLKENLLLKQKIRELEKSESKCKRAEGELQLSRERLEEAQRIAKIGNWEANLSTGDLYWSQAIFDIFGFDSKAFKPDVKSFHKAVHTDDKDLVLASEKRSEQTGLHDVVHRIIRPNGEVRIVHELARRYTDEKGKLVMLRGTVQDITDRKQAEEELKASKAQLSNALKMAHLGHWEYDIANDLFTFNDQFYEIFRTTVDQVGGYTMHSSDYARRFVHPDDVYMVTDETLKAIETTDPDFNRQVEHRILYGDGTVGHITVRFFIIKDAHGRTVKTYGVNQDITERKRAEEALRRSEKRFRSTVESSPSAMYFYRLEVDQRLIFMGANPAADRIIGIPHQALLGKTIEDAFPNLAHTDVPDMYRKIALGSLGPQHFEIPYRDERFSGFFDVTVFQTEERSIAVNFEEISERKRAEEKLRWMNTFLDSIIENIPNMVFLKDARELRFLRFNRAGEELLGYSRDNLLGKNDYDFFPKEQADFFVEKDRAVLRGRDVVDIPKESIQTHDKGERILHTKKVPILDAKGKPEYLLGISEDITERKIIEEALRERDIQFRKLSSWVPGMIYQFKRRPDGTYCVPFTTEGIRDIFGCEPQDVREDFSPIARKILQEDFDKVVRSIEYSAENLTIWTCEYRVQIPGQSIRWMHGKATPEKLAEGSIIWYGFNTDITELKRMEAEKRILEERLQRTEKMEALGTLAGGVAHDLNNVLGIVVGYSELLIDEIDESSPLKDDVIKIMEGAHRSAAIVQDLLTLARRGVQTMNVFNLNTTITDCQKTPEFEKVLSYNPKVQIKTDLDKDLLNIMGSHMHLGKTFINLVVNAVEAMPGGGVLTIATSNQSLDKPVQGYDAVNVGDYVVLSITDTGEGISEHDIKRIFEPFYTKKVMGRSGTGLGLAVVWGTVKDHNGYIDVQSEVEKGTTFTLYFPVTREEMAKAEKVIPLSEYIGNDESILIIDDIKEQRELAAKMLGRLNYKVKTISSGEEAVEYLRTEKADLIVLDMIMDPGMDGLDTYKAILEIHPKQKAIIVSGFSETDRVIEAKKLGAGDYLRKPYVQEKLGLAVRKELDRE